MSVGRCFQCPHFGEVFASGLCVRCEWMRLRDRAAATDALEDWQALDWLNQEIEERVG